MHRSGLPIFAPFLNLPSRSIKDYYQLIKEPMSLASVKKKVQGVVGRDQPTGHTLFKSWDAFDETMSLIWKNARDYNEDGSDIYNVSLELEVGQQSPLTISIANEIRTSSKSASQRPRPRSMSRHSQS